MTQEVEIKQEVKSVALEELCEKFDGGDLLRASFIKGVKILNQEMPEVSLPFEQYVLVGLCELIHNRLKLTKTSGKVDFKSEF